MFKVFKKLKITKRPEANLPVEDPWYSTEEIVKKKLPTKIIDDISLDFKYPKNGNPLLTRAEKNEIPAENHF